MAKYEIVGWPNKPKEVNFANEASLWGDEFRDKGATRVTYYRDGVRITEDELATFCALEQEEAERDREARQAGND